MSPTRALLSLIFLISLLNAAPAWPLEKFPEKCDSANSSYRKAVLTKLNHSGLLVGHNQVKTTALTLGTIAAALGYRPVPVGLGVLFQALEPPSPSNSRESLFSWEELSQDVHTADFSKPNVHWNYLTGAASHLLIWDSNRSEGGFSYSLEITDGPSLENAISQVQRCIKANKCVGSEIDGRIIEKLAQSPAFQSNLEIWGSRITPRERAQRSKELLAQLQAEYETAYSFHPYKKIRQVKPGIFEVPLVVGDFKGGESVIASEIESKWRAPGYQVRVVWVNPKSKEAKDYFKIKKEVFGASPAVVWATKTMIIPEGATLDSIPHEIGHVLGFQDTYQVIFERKTCKYIQTSDPTDLMADHQLGSVLPNAWETLSREYPLKR